jgi:hypothetical protein
MQSWNHLHRSFGGICEFAKSIIRCLPPTVHRHYCIGGLQCGSTEHNREPYDKPGGR